LQESGFQIIAATEKAETDLYKADFKEPVTMIMGSEDKGIDSKLLKMADKLVKIPVFGSIQSLNVSTAASVVFYELVRQRKGL
jgi:23S rRNA (guanosine2251-2'-O)-methyltransferase